MRRVRWDRIAVLIACGLWTVFTFYVVWRAGCVLVSLVTG